MIRIDIIPSADADGRALYDAHVAGVRLIERSPAPVYDAAVALADCGIRLEVPVQLGDGPATPLRPFVRFGRELQKVRSRRRLYSGKGARLRLPS